MVYNPRPRHRSTRPADEPMRTKVTELDLEKRALVVPPSFIDRIVLIGGDEYVKASDLVTIIQAILDSVNPRLDRIETHLSVITGQELKEGDTNVY